MTQYSKAEEVVASTTYKKSQYPHHYSSFILFVEQTKLVTQPPIKASVFMYNFVSFPGCILQ